VISSSRIKALVW